MKKIIKNIGLVLGVFMVFIIAFLFYVSPQKTTAFEDKDGQAIVNSIAEIKTIPINGHPQRLLIRGKDKNNPVLLHVHGGPGAPDYPFFGAANLEDNFTICYWDQRGAGASYSTDIPVNSMNLDNIVEDGIAVTKFLKDHLKKKKYTYKVTLGEQTWASIWRNVAQIYTMPILASVKWSILIYLSRSLIWINI